MQYKRPESVLVVVSNEHSEVLQLRRADVPDFWQSVTGALKWNEDAATAAQRELLEETGLIANDLVATGIEQRFEIVMPWKSRYAPEVTHNIERVFWAQVRGRPEVRLNPHEHVESRWLPAAQAAAEASSWTDRAAIEQLLIQRGDGDERSSFTH